MEPEPPTADPSGDHEHDRGDEHSFILDFDGYARATEVMFG